MKKGSKKTKAVEEDRGELKFTPLELAKMLHLDAEKRAADSEINFQTLLLEQIVQKIDPQDNIRKMTTKVRSLHRDRDLVLKSYEELRVEIGNRLGIDLRRFSYDDVTGTLTEVVDGELEPIQESPASSQPSE